MVLLTPNMSYAATGTDYKFDAKTGTIQKYLGKTAKVLIPSSINGIKVKSIGANAFESNKIIKSVQLPNTLYRIEKSAFKNCTALSAINTPDYLIKLDRTAFDGCKILKKSFITALNTKVQYNNNPLNNFDFNKSTGTITSYHGVNDEVVVPSSINGAIVKRIAHTTFYRNSNITKVTIPESVTEVERQSFLYCTSLKSIIFPKAINEIGLQMFWSCKSLEEVTLPEALKVISEQAFAGCTSLKTIILPDELETVGRGAFENCTSLEEMIFPSSVFEVKQAALARCDALKKVTFLGETFLEYNGSTTFPTQKITIASPLDEFYAPLAERLGYTFIKLDK